MAVRGVPSPPPRDPCWDKGEERETYGAPSSLLPTPATVDVRGLNPVYADTVPPTGTAPEERGVYVGDAAAAEAGLATGAGEGLSLALLLLLPTLFTLLTASTCARKSATCESVIVVVVVLLCDMGCIVLAPATGARVCCAPTSSALLLVLLLFARTPFVAVVGCCRPATPPRASPLPAPNPGPKG